MHRLKKRKHVVGRDFTGDMNNRPGSYLSVSFKKEDLPVLEQIKRLALKDGVPASEIVVDSVRLTFGALNLEIIKESILQRYVLRELTGPELFKTFYDVLEWELANNSIPDIIIKWGISLQNFCCIMYLYGISFRRELKEFIP